jgi:uncharacterized protein (TIGR03086 family)
MGWSDMPQIDLHDAADQMARLIEAVPDDALDRTTPCDIPLAQLIDHVGTFASAFIGVATKDVGDRTAPPPPPTGDLEAGWRERIVGDLSALADAWDAPGAWEGMTKAGGLDLPGELAGRVALDELIVHRWDIARSIGQPFVCDEAAVREIADTIRQFRGDDQGEIPGLFGPVVPVPDDAPLLHRVLGLTGRDPGWEGTDR